VWRTKGRQEESSNKHANGRPAEQAARAAQGPGRAGRRLFNMVHGGRAGASSCTAAGRARRVGLFADAEVALPLHTVDFQ